MAFLYVTFLHVTFPHVTFMHVTFLHRHFCMWHFCMRHLCMWHLCMYACEKCRISTKRMMQSSAQCSVSFVSKSRLKKKKRSISQFFFLNACLQLFSIIACLQLFYHCLLAAFFHHCLLAAPRYAMWIPDAQLLLQERRGDAWKHFITDVLIKIPFLLQEIFGTFIATKNLNWP